MKTTILTFYFLIITLSGCNSNDDNSFTPTLPPITQTGANTFGCYIDSNLLVPRDGEGTFNSPSKGMQFWGSSDQTYNEIYVWDYKSGSESLFFRIQNLHQNGEGSYEIKESNCQLSSSGNPNPTVNLFCRKMNQSSQLINLYCSIENSGILKITRYDLVNKIVSGTFSCRAVNKDDPDDIIEITEGRFDIKWDALEEKEFP
ncbi:MAG: hypothetical protein ABF260_03400 [Flavobacteriaceae bacterium]